MKLFKKSLLFLLAIVVLAVLGVFIYLQTLKPQYSGEITMKGLKDGVEVFYDDYGIPHIYAQNEEDAYYALGYVHAQDRLFQMEMMRRVGAGRLADILGPDLVQTDKFLRTLGIAQKAEEAVEMYMSSDTAAYQRDALAYLSGINHFIENGKTPLEFTLIGIPKEKFTPKDIYLIVGYMGFSFALALRTDPIVEKVYKQYGTDYLKDLAHDWPAGWERIPTQKKDSVMELSPPYEEQDALPSAMEGVSAMLDNLPVPLWLGSNGWVVAPKKTKSGKVLFCNDTHIRYGQPSVWYEAHLEAPGLSVYGNHLGGFPFPFTGHNRFAAIGLTMFENDDIDLYREKKNPENPNQYWANDQWEEMKIREEVIKVKGGEDVRFEVRTTRHGPVMNEVIPEIYQREKEPVSMWWIYDKFPVKILQAAYKFSHAKSIADVRTASSMVAAPGLNVMYGDIEGNIAWWTAAKLPIRPEHVNGKLFLDGASGKDDPLGWLDFEQNPQSENPESGFVYSANNQPDTMGGMVHQGYYVPEHRAKRIMELLNNENDWDTEKMKGIITDMVSNDYVELAKQVISNLDENTRSSSETHVKAAAILNNWDGDHQLDDVAPTIWYKLLYNILEMTLRDELGEADFNTFLSTHLMKRTFPILLKNDSSLWWDDVNTEEKETRDFIFTKAFDRAVSELSRQLGGNVGEWKWGKVHTIEHVHPIGRKPPLDKVFNVGPIPIMGGNEVINNTGFTLTGDGSYKALYGPAMRRIIDFADLENSLSVLPTGQSGNVMSDHYADQAEMYAKGEFRKQMMNREEIEKTAKGKLVFNPELEFQH
ncbi:MAG: penicillin acylase family protein [Flavobacteriales bacterium]|nr:MAG: penicillin acylase family protein [Flavobacteriales bacterium]